MKRKKILYVYDFGELPESNRYQELKDNINNKRYEVLSDFYAQYDPKAALYDIKNYIKENHIDIVIGEKLGGYIVSLLDRNVKRILINPLYNPIKEFNDYTTTTKDAEGNDITVKSIPDHMVDFYSKSEYKPIYDENMLCIFSNDYSYNFKQYFLKNENTILTDDILSIIKENI